MKHLLSFVLFSCVMFLNMAQDKGVLSGGFQSESQFYRSDDKIAATSPDESIGSNNYFKLDYTFGDFKFGVRYEAYMPPILGYPTDFEGRGIANRFASYQTDFLNVTVGNFYEQFGSGMILRAYEERLLGIDNSIEGINVKLSPVSGIDLTMLAGNQREYFEIGDGTVRGFDAGFDINELAGSDWKTRVRLEGSFVSKFEEYTGPDSQIEEDVRSYSGRIKLNRSNWDLNSEYVEKDVDPGASNLFNTQRKGRAFLTNINLYKKGFGFSTTFRRIENMDFRSERNASQTNLWINYLPAETRQHGYLLPNIYPYAVQLNGEIGGQVSISYLVSKKSSLGGKYGTRLALNYSRFNKLKKSESASAEDNFDSEFFQFSDTLLYSDFNFEIEKKVSKNLKFVLNYIQMNYNKFEIEGVPSENVKSQIAVVEMLYKPGNRRSLRTELQHLSTKQDKENWAGFLVEYSMAPKWSFHFFDQYNYGYIDKVHYYQTGFSYTKNSSRLAISYGRQRGGLICVGGVCRNVPSATGLSMSLSTSFSQ
ncbi:MAG: DUF6029 family protein [Cyclobacteriaceae bacterium]